MLRHLLGAAQLIFLHNFFRSIRRGEKAAENPWQATTLEWQPGAAEVCRWPYDYSLPDSTEDWVAQNQR